MFNGRLSNYLRCNVCQNAREKPDLFVDLSLNIQNCATLQDSCRAYIQKEVLDKDNKVQCSTCGIKQASTRGMYVCLCT